jgi:prolyl oligopeptidase
MRYPAAERGPVVDAWHDQRVPDPYRWLEDPAAAATRRWSAAQDELWRRYARALPDRDRFHARVAELSEVGLVTAPVWRGGRRFWRCGTGRQEHPVLLTCGADGVEETLIDPVELDPTGRTTLDAWHPDRDGRRVAYQVSRHGDERAELYVLDVASRELVDGPIDRCRYSPVVWLPGGDAFYYVRSRQVRLHRLGTDAETDALIRGDTASYGLGISEDGRWLVLSAGTATGNDLWLADLSRAAPERPPWRRIQQGGTAQTVAHVGPDGRLYLATTRDAPNGRLCVADPAAPERWHNLVPADAGAALTGFAILDGTVLLASRIRDGAGEIGVHDLVTGEWIGDLPLPGTGTVGPLSVRSESGHEAWFTYTDCVTPPTVYRFDARTGSVEWWAGPPDIQLPDFEIQRLTAVSADGAPVPVDVIAKGGGPRPAILYGYGGFGIPITPNYSAYILAWVEAGGAFGLAHLRSDGRLAAKQNVVDDFVAAAEHLVAEGWTTPGMLGACGESNGGLVVGAALTRRPELFAAAVCAAPLLDMLRYEHSGMGASWRAEYGSAGDPAQFRTLHAYSPYHHVRPRVRYPAVLFTVSTGDSRVDPMHARKMCAALQWATTGTGPVLLRAESGVGHGVRATSSAVARAADMLAFLAANTGLTR